MKKHIGFKTIVSLLLLMSSVAHSHDLFHIEVQRNMTCADGSIMGVLTANGKEIGRTLELPWRNNEKNISHINPGTFNGKIRSDGSLSWRIELDDPTRKNIQIHRGNFQSHTQGCILLGTELMGNTCGVSESVAAMGKLGEEILSFASKDNMSVPIEIQISVYD